MSALTREVQDPKSPVARWLRSTFPHHREVQAVYRDSVGPALVLPSPTVAAGTQGAAIDWWLRFLVDPAPSVDLALAGIRSRRMPCPRAGADLLHDLGAIDDEGEVLGRIEPARFTDRSDEWWARVCYALALLVEVYRSPKIDGSRLMWLSNDSRAPELLALANTDEVADLIEMRDLAVQRLLPALPPGTVVTGSTFDGSADVSADADLIAAGTLVDFKASQGGTPRVDGSRAARLARSGLDQLLGYVLLDYSDAFALDAVAIYAARFGSYTAWPLADLCTQLAGRPVELPALRQEFAQVLRDDLPAYRAASMAAWLDRRRAGS